MAKANHDAVDPGARPKVGGCSVPGCAGRHHARGFCAAHVGKDQRLFKRSGGRQALRPDGTTMEVCTVAGCHREVQARELCAAHLQRLRRTGDIRADEPVRPLAPQDGTRRCTVAGCDEPIVPQRAGSRNRGARGMCLRHYRTWLRAERKKGSDGDSHLTGGTAGGEGRAASAVAGS